MVSTYKPIYYTTLHDSIASICKTILPFSLKKRRLPPAAAAEKQQSDNLKWQQESFHQMLNLMGLFKEGIISGNEVAAFRTRLLDTLVASPLHHEPPPVLRDKLVFLQELLYAGCISEVDYHASKRPLLQRLAVQGDEIDARDLVIVSHDVDEASKDDEWSFIDLRDEKHMTNNKDPTALKNHHKAVNKIKEAVSSFGFMASNKNGSKILTAAVVSNQSVRKSNSDSIFTMESLLSSSKTEKTNSGKKGAWSMIDGLKKWRKNDSEYAQGPPLATCNETYEGKLVENPIAEGPDTKNIKRKLHPDASPTDFFVDKVLGEKIKKELSRIQKEPGIPPLRDDEIDIISTRLPVDKEDLKSIFPKAWCNKYSEIVLDIVRKEFKHHIKEMGGGGTTNKPNVLQRYELQPQCTFPIGQFVNSTQN